MEVSSLSPPPTKCIADDKLTGISTDFTKLKFTEEGEEEIQNLEKSWSKLEESVEFHNEDEDEEEEEEEEFSFACVNTEGSSPITADEAFENGQIRPVFPYFNRSDLLLNDEVLVTDDDRPRVRKLFVDDRSVDGELLFASKNDTVSDDMPRVRKLVVEDGNRTSDGAASCRKSNSTGFSKLWRFRDLVMRSNSDGRDAFVFLNQSSSSSVVDKKKKGKEKTTSSEKKKTTSSEKNKGKEKSGIEKVYERNREKKEEGKRHRSYLPYKQFGFFTNVNGLSKNIHPF